MSQIAASASQKPLRLWPGVVAAAIILLGRFLVPAVISGTFGVGLIGGLTGALAIVVWWLFFSRAPWSERIGAILLMIVALFATRRFVHPSIATGMMGFLLYVYAIPVLMLALVVGAVVGRRLSDGRRRTAMIAAILLACGAFTLLRTDGITGDDGSLFAWRWTPTAEERLLAEAGALPAAMPAAPLSAQGPQQIEPPAAGGKAAEAAIPDKAGETSDDAARGVAAISPAPPAVAAAAAEWPGFRGPARDGAVRGVRIDADWSRRPPVELWRRPVGPGWSSFSVQGDLIYTQEQRGDDEIVSCYRLSTGEPVWAHRDPVRFYESNGGAGPRATPAVSGGRVFALGATGVLNALDARTGALLWSRNAAADTGATLPGWGFAGSPLVVGDLVIAAASGALAGYDAATGKPRWVGPPRGGGYSSPHLVTIDGVVQVVLLSGGGAAGVAPADGALLWEHSWEPGVSIVQPGLAEGDILLSGGDMMGGIGLRRLALSHGTSGWSVNTRWSTRGLKPYFNDFVVHKGHAYGFDGTILASIDLADGARKWKGGRYGSGQLVLLPDQDLLLVLSEEGDLALVSAAPDGFKELSRVPAIEGKTWNHPVLVGDILLVRNGEEMAAFRVLVAGR